MRLLLVLISLTLTIACGPGEDGARRAVLRHISAGVPITYEDQTFAHCDSLLEGSLDNLSEEALAAWTACPSKPSTFDESEQCVEWSHFRENDGVLRLEVERRSGNRELLPDLQGPAFDILRVEHWEVSGLAETTYGPPDRCRWLLNDSLEIAWVEHY